MGVLVCYDDFTYDVINDYHLDHLLATGCILGYDNSAEWAKKETALQPANPQVTTSHATQAGRAS